MLCRVLKECLTRTVQGPQSVLIQQMGVISSMFFFLRLRAFTALPEDQSSAPSTQVRQLITAAHTTSTKVLTLSLGLHTHMAYMATHTHTCKNIF